MMAKAGELSKAVVLICALVVIGAMLLPLCFVADMVAGQVQK